MQYIRNGVLVLPDGLLRGHVLAFDAQIRGILPDDGTYACAEDARGCYVAPGLIDLHIHGFGGRDASDGDADGLRAMSRLLPENGVTAFFPTLMTLPQSGLERAVSAVRQAMGSAPGARIPGAHLEGPFLNPRRAGAQSAEHMRPVSSGFLRENRDVVRILTLAPELSGADRLIRELRGEMLLSAGHTDATCSQAAAAFDGGVRHVTHLFNAMSGLHHREPGAAAAALADDRVCCELVADGFHVSAALYPLIRRMKGERLVLVTDCTCAGGMGDGEYLLGDQRFALRGGRCLLPDGTLAGSVLRMNEAVRNLVRSGAPVHEAVFAASLAPARQVGLDAECGSIEIGKRADLVLLKPDFSVSRTYVGGKPIYSV